MQVTFQIESLLEAENHLNHQHHMLVRAQEESHLVIPVIAVFHLPAVEVVGVVVPYISIATITAQIVTMAVIMVMYHTHSMTRHASLRPKHTITLWFHPLLFLPETVVNITSTATELLLRQHLSNTSALHLALTMPHIIVVATQELVAAKCSGMVGNRKEKARETTLKPEAAALQGDE